MKWSLIVGSLLCAASVVGCNGDAVTGAVEDPATGGSGGGGGASGSGGSGTSGASPVDPAEGPLEKACVDSCKKERDCGRAVSDLCERSCVDGGNLFSGECRRLIADEATCMAELECGALDTYLNARRGDPSCGDAFDAFATACTVDSGKVPAQCTSYCETAVRCDASALEKQGCEESCLLSLSGLKAQFGPACETVERDAYGCFGGLDCADMKSLASGNVPQKCKDLETSWKNECH